MYDVNPCKSDHKIAEVKWNNSHFQSSNQWCRLWKTRYRISDSSVLCWYQMKKGGKYIDIYRLKVIGSLVEHTGAVFTACAMYLFDGF